MLACEKLSNGDINRVCTQKTSTGMTSGQVSFYSVGDVLLLHRSLRILGITPEYECIVLSYKEWTRMAK